MQLIVREDAAAVAQFAASEVASQAAASIAQRGRFVLALSGGRTPWEMLRALAALPLPWKQIHIVQVDERVAPDGHAERNLSHIRANLLERVALPAENVHPMPVTAVDLEAAAGRYEHEIATLAGRPIVLDLALLGIGTDGHTASLVPGDLVLEVRDRDVATTAAYQGRRRMTLTFPALDRCRRLLYLVTGAEKAAALAQLRLADPRIPAGRISDERATIAADRAAAEDST